LKNCEGAACVVAMSGLLEARKLLFARIAVHLIGTSQNPSPRNFPEQTKKPHKSK